MQAVTGWSMHVCDLACESQTTFSIFFITREWDTAARPFFFCSQWWWRTFVRRKFPLVCSTNPFTWNWAGAQSPFENTFCVAHGKASESGTTHRSVCSWDRIGTKVHTRTQHHMDCSLRAIFPLLTVRESLTRPMTCPKSVSFTSGFLMRRDMIDVQHVLQQQSPTPTVVDGTSLTPNTLTFAWHKILKKITGTKRKTCNIWYNEKAIKH